MDKKGQTLIIFVILVPIIITMLALVVDVGMLIHEAQKARGVLDNGITLAFQKNDDAEIEKILKQNDIPTTNLQVEHMSDQIEVSLEYKMDSFFGKIININEYEIVVKRIGKKVNEKIVITKKE